MSKLKDVVGIVLSAGYGTRLKPFTDHLPKPLVPLLDKTPLWHQIALLKKAGINEIYLNIHFMPHIFRAYLKNNKLENIQCAFEANILGTGGGIKNIINMFGIKKPIIVLNGDTVSNINLDDMWSEYVSSDCDAMMLLIRDDTIPYENAVFCNEEFEVKYIKQKPRCLSGLSKYKFLGIHILNPSVFKYLPDNGCINRETYPVLIKNSYKLLGYITKKESLDIGTPENLYKANIRLLKSRLETPVFTCSYISKKRDKNGNFLGKRIKMVNSFVKNSVISDNVLITNSIIVDSIVFPNTKISNERVKRCVANNEYRYII
ncbi:MAG: NDP-sugar synthase [Deltaproteobacteria bacterium]|nr:NDP-sugar synthase [Deltaproteobacteria bacterium]